MIGVVGFVVLGLGAMIALLGAPKIRRPDVDPALFERATDGAARLTCAGCGSMPILMLSVGYTGYVKLGVLLTFIVLPAYGVILLLGMLLPNVGRRAVTGFLGGIVAVLVYDLTRLALSYSQGGSDPIPHIGTMIFGAGAPWWVGYVWRTLGNGAGLGIVFTMLCPRKWWGPKLGLVFASFIGLGMLGFLSLFPQAQTQLFKVSWQTMVNSSLGHATYGLVLGAMARGAVRRQARRPGKARHAMPDEVTPPGAARRPEFLSTAGPAGGAASAPSWAAGENWVSDPVAQTSGTGWVRPQDVPTELLPVVPSVPPPSPRRRARGSHSR